MQFVPDLNNLAHPLPQNLVQRQRILLDVRAWLFNLLQQRHLLLRNVDGIVNMLAV